VIIDVHGHITHPELLRRYPMPATLGDIEGMLDRKSEAGIGLTVVGSPVGFGTMSKRGHDNFAQPLDELKEFHEWLAETVEKYSPRLAAYAFTNPFGSDELLELTAQTVRDGRFLGLIVNTSVKGEYLDSPSADVSFAMAEELDVPIFLHPPAEPVGSDSLEEFRLVEQVARFCDVTVSLATLAFGGRLERHPSLQFIAATAGGAIGLLPARLDQAYQPRHWGAGKPPEAEGGAPRSGPPGGPPPFENKISQPPSTYLRQVYVDTANSSVPNHLANLDLMGPERMLFGTDSPPLATPFGAAIAAVEQLPISEDDKQKIFHGNAERLFRLEERHPTLLAATQEGS
jgi:aminocarboxymuconate-semialdehyde decarboxylase